MMSVNFIGPKYFRNSAGFSESVAHIRRIIHLASTTSLYTRKCHRRLNEGELTLKILLKNASDLSLCHPPTDECLGKLFYIQVQMRLFVHLHSPAPIPTAFILLVSVC
ncbi:hypothetical protein M404DRAFT_852745 [Pisolithus tinctorius Marx 270]|uniref:Uncharacterized protein n=1 Tax=Pisolithus tinctorius Marx 270 TaxID=870435 RepID=A0A0C3NSL4_PISTI|nr:hypothetical protein M404DRAFT_852745 [Pisolithus tinctorius Marx 270]